MFKLFNETNFDGYTVVVPSVSVGNVGQFVADLLISSMKMNKIGCVWDSAILPVIGGDPYNLKSETLMTSCELYSHPDTKTAVLQIRSPLVGKQAMKFLEAIAKYFSQYSLKQMVILSSSFAAEKHTVNSIQFRYFRNDFLDGQIFKSLGWMDFNSEPEREGNLIIHGGGFATKLFYICAEAKIPCLVLFKYCSEGNNIPDALDMTTYLNGWLKLLKETGKPLNYVLPPSWNLLFGGPPSKEIY